MKFQSNLFGCGFLNAFFSLKISFQIQFPDNVLENNLEMYQSKKNQHILKRGITPYQPETQKSSFHF